MNRLVVTDDGITIRATVYQNGDPVPLTVVELTVERAVTVAAELIAAIAAQLALRAEYRREP